MIRWLSSASIYGISETMSVYLTETEPVYINIAKTIIGGATADSMFMRYFHINIDNKIQSPLKRMLIEQVTCAPLYDAGYLTLNNGLSWNFNDWWNIYQKDCMFWPGASYIGYRFVPTYKRYLYVSSASLFWSTWRASITKN